VLADDAAFGVGTHPTTRMCLEALCAAEPDGTLLDLGCGSGVLSIAAALLGWRAVVAVDRSPEALAATAINARRSRANVETREADVATAARTPAALVVANVPPAAHAAIAEQLASSPRVLIASGIQAQDADDCARVYAAAGLEEAGRRDAGGWALLTLRRAGPCATWAP
jgi:ribosomal protein L11 methyltransferase